MEQTPHWRLIDHCAILVSLPDGHWYELVADIDLGDGTYGPGAGILGDIWIANDSAGAPARTVAQLASLCAEVEDERTTDVMAQWERALWEAARHG